MLDKSDPLAGLSAEREITVILEGIGEGFYAVDSDWRIRLFNSDAEKHFGLPRADVLGHVLWELFPSARDTELGRTFRQVMVSRETMNSEAQSVLFPGRWMEYRLFPLGDGMGVRFRDITARKRGEELRQLLLNELNHRVKNTLAIVQGIASQTFRNTQVPAAVRNSFEARLMALAAVHDVLTHENWDSAQLRDVVTAVLTPYGGDDVSRFRIRGPNLRMQPRGAVAFALALHELCTNAVKYGALSQPSGRIDIGWSTDEDTFRFDWRERGGPPVTPNPEKGFGTRLIERALAAELGGEATIDFASAGIACRIVAPLPGVRAAPPSPAT
jgi:PAS domain S-box-containing protein